MSWTQTGRVVVCVAPALRAKESELSGRLVAAIVAALGAVARLRRSVAAAAAVLVAVEVELKTKMAAVMQVAHSPGSLEALKVFVALEAPEVLEARKMLAGSRPAGSGQSELESGHAPCWSLLRLGLGLQFGPWPGCPL